MSCCRLPFSLLLLLRVLICLQFKSQPLIRAFTLRYPFNSTHVVEDVLKEISERQKWDLEGVRISKLEASKIRFGAARRYEFRIRLGESHLLFKFPYEVDSWTKYSKESNAFGDLVGEVGSVAVLDTYKFDGPFDLWVGGDDQLSLSLPLNTSHRGLKRILVGEGITVEVTTAQEVSLFHAFDLDFLVNGSIITKKGTSGFFLDWQSSCRPLLPVRIVGSASLVAYKTRNHDADIETTFLSNETIELLPEKCYSSNMNMVRARPNNAMGLKIARLEAFLRSFYGNRNHRNGLSGFLRANVKASTIIRFQLELERNIGNNETLPEVLAEWRTRPSVERFWFEVMARVETGKLKPITVKKVRPFLPVDSASWSNLMSNISFTNFPSILVPPEALTLDVKW